MPEIDAIGGIIVGGFVQLPRVHLQPRPAAFVRDSASRSSQVRSPAKAASFRARRRGSGSDSVGGAAGGPRTVAIPAASVAPA